MKKKINQVLDDFNQKDEEKNVDKVIIPSGGGELIERVDKVFITESGKQLLKD
ncbi:MAG: hypothetical protein ACOCVF_00475 [bacterium]